MSTTLPENYPMTAAAESQKLLLPLHRHVTIVSLWAAWTEVINSVPTIPAPGKLSTGGINNNNNMWTYIVHVSTN